MDTLILVDGNNKVFISEWGEGLYYNGKRTSGILTFLLSLRGYVKKYGRDNIIICWDSYAKSKHVLYGNYKKNRKRTPLYYEIKEEIKTLIDIIPSFGIKQCKVNGYEADELLGDLHSIHKGKKIIVSTDSDLFQLLDEDTDIHKGKEIVTVKTLEEKTGLTPTGFLLKKIIVGDYTDNIKGIEKIGPKTFYKILKESGSEENIWEHDKVREHMDIIQRNYELIVLSSLNLKGSIEAYEQKTKLDIKQVRKCLFKLGFFSLLKRLNIWIKPFMNKREVIKKL